MSRLQFNLLPDVKLEFNRTRRLKQLVTTVAVLVTGVSLALFIVLFLTVNVVQKKQLKDAAKDIDDTSQKLKKVPQIDQIITVQNQLTTLADLHKNKHITSRMFEYIPKVTPNNVSINKIEIDLGESKMTISGKATTQANVNTFIDSLKFANYKVGDGDSTPAFSNVVESSFSITQGSITYTIDCNFDPTLFMNTTDKDGKPIEPVLTVSQPGGSSLSPTSTLFNSSQSSGGSQ